MNSKKSTNQDVNKYRYYMVTLQDEPIILKAPKNMPVNGTLPCQLPTRESVIELFTQLCDEFVFQLEKAPSSGRYHWQCCLKLATRKRKMTLINDIVSGLCYQTSVPVQVQKMEGTWDQAVAYCTKTDTRVTEVEPYISPSVTLPYKGSDIEFLSDRSNWYKWQEKLFNLLFSDPPKMLHTPNDRTIYWITDSQGNTGKSKFVKYCCYYNKACAKISFGNAGQLRSSIIHAGSKKCYFVDIPRTLGTDDSMNSIMSALEDTKNGYLTSSYYGESKILMMEPPHIVVISNRSCPKDKMSLDRWQVYYIIDKDLIKTYEDN